MRAASASTLLSTSSSSSSLSSWIVLPLLLLCLTALSCTSLPTDTLKQRQSPLVQPAEVLASAQQAAQTQTTLHRRHRCFMGKCKPPTHDTNGEVAAQQIDVAATRAQLGERLAVLASGDVIETDCAAPFDDTTYYAGYMTQKLDNFDKDNEDVWRQHFQVQNSSFWGNETEQIIFLNIGGEGQIEDKWVCNPDYTYMKAAAEHRALVIQLEHRFFGPGQSGILNNLRTRNLKYLTVEQALADMNAFIAAYSKNFQNPKWVLWGGSYPATLAALSRQQDPDVSVGAIASSAPLQPVVDFYQYSRVMEMAFDDYSSQCYNAIQKAFKLMLKSLFTTEGRRTLGTAFKFELQFEDTSVTNGVEVTPSNLYTVASEIFSAFQGQVQYTYDGRAEITKRGEGRRQNINSTCEMMTNTDGLADPLAALHNVYAVSNAATIDSIDDNVPVQNNYKTMIEDLQETQLTTDNAGAMWLRGWLWLSCNQFGWLQSTTNSDLFGAVVPISYQEQLCQDLFDMRFNDSNIQATAAKFGTADSYKGTNVYLSNGQYDPWSSLGVTNGSADALRYTHTTARSGHCSDLYPAYEHEPSALENSRDLLNQHLNEFLGRPTGGGNGQPSNPGGGNNGGTATSTQSSDSSAASLTSSIALITTSIMLLLTRL